MTKISLSIEKKISFYVKLKNLIFILIEIICIFLLYKLIYIYLLKSLLMNGDIFVNVEKSNVNVAHNVLTQVNINDNMYQIKSRILELNDQGVLLNNNIIKSDNINGFVGKIIEIKSEKKIILENNPIIKIKPIKNR